MSAAKSACLLISLFLMSCQSVSKLKQHDRISVNHDVSSASISNQQLIYALNQIPDQSTLSWKDGDAVLTFRAHSTYTKNKHICRPFQLSTMKGKHLKKTQISLQVHVLLMNSSYKISHIVF